MWGSLVYANAISLDATREVRLETLLRGYKNRARVAAFAATEALRIIEFASGEALASRRKNLGIVRQALDCKCCSLSKAAVLRHCACHARSPLPARPGRHSPGMVEQKAAKDTRVLPHVINGLYDTSWHARNVSSWHDMKPRRATLDPGSNNRRRRVKASTISMTSARAGLEEESATRILAICCGAAGPVERAPCGAVNAPVAPFP